MRIQWIMLPFATMASALLATQTNPASFGSETKKSKRETTNWQVLHSLYPKRSLVRGEEGLVGFIIKIDGEGNARECQVTHTSGYPLLDRDTCRLVLIHATYKKPSGLRRWQSKDYEGVVNWTLPTSIRGKVHATPKEIKAAAAPEKLVCRRHVKTGTVAHVQTTCLPPPEWLEAWAEQQDWWDKQLKKGIGATGRGDVAQKIQ